MTGPKVFGPPDPDPDDVMDSRISGTLDARDLIPLTGVASVARETDAVNDLVWSISVVHSYDGYEVGLTFADQNPVLGADSAERLSLAILRASMTAGMWNDNREKVN
jgi:hypothetical protein